MLSNDFQPSNAFTINLKTIGFSAIRPSTEGAQHRSEGQGSQGDLEAFCNYWEEMQGEKDKRDGFFSNIVLFSLGYPVFLLQKSYAVLRL